MIFPTDDVYRQRRAILERVDAGKISDLEGAHEALAIDPDDANALLCVAQHAQDAGELDAAERYAREAIRHHPFSADAYMLLAGILDAKQPGSVLARGYGLLSLLKREFESEDGGTALEFETWEEPPETESELRPHRLVHQLREDREFVLERSLVDEILANAEACEPLLLGILREYGEGELADVDFSVVERALVLLGEIGNVSSLPAITEFLGLEDNDLAGPADWACRRISYRKPEETVAAARNLIPSAGAGELAMLAEQLAMMPDAPGRAAALDELMARIPEVPADEREPLAFAALATFYIAEGEHSPHAKALERQYAGSFSKEARADLRKLHETIRGEEPYQAEPDELSVYDICCTEPQQEDHHHHHHEPVRVEQKPGRNDPCWCGSGKKYKKCHLDEDQQN